ncbi:MAG: dipeptidase [Phycisphaerae bacterium]
MLPEAVREYLDANRDRHLAELCELLRIPSIANVRGEPDRCRQAADWLAERLEQIGLSASIEPTGGRPVVFAEARPYEDAPTVLIYGHYDVQPADPLNEWDTPPFEPSIRDGAVYARGANDDKGQLYTHIMAMDAWQNAGGGLPVNVKVLLEGEEEVSSPNLEPYVAENAHRLSADAAVISDSEFFAPDLPCLVYGLRGIVYVEITFYGPTADLHSGSHGGVVVNPANALGKLIARMHDDNGRVALPGFYDDVRELTDDQRRLWNELPFDEADYARSLGVSELAGGESDRDVLQRRWSRPTLDVNGMVSGYTEQGAKTIIPARATAKVSCRLVPDQDPEKVLEGFRSFIAENTPAGIRSELTVHSTARPVLLSRQSPAIRSASAAMAEAFGRKPAMIRTGGSVPIAELIQRLLGIDAAMMGFGLSDDNVHSPNEHFRLEQFYRGSCASASFLRELGALAH